MGFSPLHRKVALRLALVILAASALIDLVVIIGAQQLLVKDRRELGSQWLRSSCRGKRAVETGSGGGALAAVCLDGHFQTSMVGSPTP